MKVAFLDLVDVPHATLSLLVLCHSSLVDVARTDLVNRSEVNLSLREGLLLLVSTFPAIVMRPAVIVLVTVVVLLKPASCGQAS